MSPVNNLLICGILQVSLLALAGLLAIPILRHLRRNATVLLLHTLIGISILTVAAFLPIPSWLSAPDSSVPGNVAQASSVELTADLRPVADPPKIAPVQFGLREYLAAGVEGFRTMNTPTPAVFIPEQRVPTAEVTWQPWREHWFLWLLTCGILLGLIRLVGGLWSVHCLIQSSRPLKVAKLQETVDVLTAEMRCPLRIEIRESHQLSMAATVGWRKPVILLSSHWRTWTDEQLRSVLAHEIAHVARGDFATSLIAQTGLILHFYHPLVHWLVRQLRLEQELAADGLAAQAVGGSTVYLCSIGELALVNSREHVSWPAHAFLPTRRTFLRRIEMLRDLKLFSGQTSRAVRIASLLAVVGVTIGVAGLRPPEVAAQSPRTKPAVAAGIGPGPALAAAPTAFAISHVPEDAFVVATVNVPDLVPFYDAARKAMNAAEDAPPIQEGERQFVDLMKKCRSVMLVLAAVDRTTPDPVAIKADFIDSSAREAAITALKSGREFQKDTWDNVPVEFADPLASVRLGETTVIYGHAPTVRRMLKAGDSSQSSLTKSDAWKSAESGTIALAVDATKLKTLMADAPQNPVTAMLTPLWMQANSYTLGIGLKKDISLSLTAESPDEKSAKTLESSLTGGIALLSGLVANAQAQLPEDSSDKKVMEILASFLATQQFERTGNTMTLKLAADQNIGDRLITEALVPSVIRARAAAQRSLQANNMKQVMLALHNYEAANGHFPPSVVIDKESGVPRSWRVEILPYIDQAQLYQEYRKNEPWDSEANKAVLAKMPATYRHPSQSSDSTMSSIFMPYGEGLVAGPDDKEGLQLRDVIDGLSNTIALVESKQDIPWTKPEDLKFDLTAEKLPSLGFVPEGWHVAMGDGSVRFISSSIEVSLMKKLLTTSGGEVIPSP